MGRVWLLERKYEDSFDLIYRRELAVKTFDFVRDEEAVERELNIWISLDHPAILPLMKIGRLNYRIAAIMPLLRGNLDDVLDERGAFSENDTIKVLAEIVTGLKYAWSSCRVLHLDLKPSNVLVEGSDALRTKIGDWGISRLVRSGTAATKLQSSSQRKVTWDQRTAYAAGTPLYMAPERFTGNWTLAVAADMYSLGMMAVQLSTGVLPFRFGEIDPEHEIMNGSVLDNAHHMLAGQSQTFQQMWLQCLDPNPANRPADYDELIASLKACARERGA